MAWPLMIGATAFAAGFTFATWKTIRVAHPVLAAPAYGVTLSGFVVGREERERSGRIVIHVHSISGPRTDTKLEWVRLSVRKGTAPAVAASSKCARGSIPPLTPLRPGGYDFARDLLFPGHRRYRICARQYQASNAAASAGPLAPLYRRPSPMRDAIDARIRSVISATAARSLRR